MTGIPGWMTRRLLFAALLGLSASQGQEPDTAAKIYSRAAKSVLLVLLKSSDSQIVAQGTGFLVESGRIVTNEHVIRGGVPLIDVGGARIPATIELVDATNDIAVLTTTAEISAEPLVLSDKLPVPGASVFAIGNPRGLDKSISTGVLAGVREVPGRQLLQITTPISPGSSGGPVFDASGKVVGVTVGSIEDGQNLNFAVPASAVIKLLHGQPSDQANAVSLLETADSLRAKQNQEPWSDAPDSPYQKLETQVVATLSSAVDRAGKDMELLVRIAKQYSDTEPAIAISAAERALQIKPSSDANLALAKALNWQAIFSSSDAGKERAFLERSEKASKQAISLTKRPTAEMYYTLGNALSMKGSYPDADAALRQALELNRTNPDAQQQAAILRELITVADNLKRPADADKWFNALIQTGAANFLDWRGQATRLDAAKRFSEAGTSWQQAATLSQIWTDWCEAQGSFELVPFGMPGREDAILYSARKCISEGSGKQQSEARLAEAHRALADVLNDRGVYEEALSHAKEATILNPESPWYYDSEAVALLGLHRNQEAINAAKQAIRLSDGKFGIMHFHLGNAYFETENWQFAEQSFEKAAQLMPAEDASAYNAALCFQRMGLFLDAAHWFEEALRRNPNRTDKQDILNQISILRRR